MRVHHGDARGVARRLISYSKYEKHLSKFYEEFDSDFIGIRTKV